MSASSSVCPPYNNQQPRQQESTFTATSNQSNDTDRSKSETISNKNKGGEIIKKRRSGVSSIFRKHTNPADRHVELDDEEGKSEFFLLLLFESVGDSAFFFFGSIFGLVVWSVICAYVSGLLRVSASQDPGGVAERWIEDIDNCSSAMSVVGTLFVFIVVFRFNACYDRWWESRIFWGDIISKCMELGMMNRRWIRDEDLANRMSRFIILFSYTSKSLLRGKSIAEEWEDGPALVKRGLLTQAELDDMHSHPCWQPHYCLDMIRAIIVEAHTVPKGKGLVFDENNKAHGQLFRCFDNTLKDMNKLIGNCVRVRASGLPASYDAITMTSFYTFFILAAPIWSVAIGWMTPIIIFAASMIVLFLIVMGTKLVDPFGYDKVDIPMEDFCHTIESQIYAIDERSRSGVIDDFARSSKPSHRTYLTRNATMHIPKLA